MKGRIVQCSRCAGPTSKGTSQVHRKILFHFHWYCWNTFRSECHHIMQHT